MLPVLHRFLRQVRSPEFRLKFPAHARGLEETQTASRSRIVVSDVGEDVAEVLLGSRQVANSVARLHPSCARSFLITA